MAEEQQSKNIGELFVEFGAKGLGSLIKGINTVSASFLLVKNAGAQALKPIKNMMKEATGTVTAWDKLSTVMGMSLKELQDIETFSRLNNIDFSSYINQLQTVQQKLMDIRTGQSNDVQGLTLLGLTAYDFDPKKPLEFMDKVKQRVLSLDEVTAASALRWLGLSQDLLYVWKQQNSQFDNRLKLNDKELEKLKQQQTNWNILKTTWWAAQNKFMANQSVINNLLNKTTDWLTGMHPIIENTARLFNKWLDAKHPYLEKLLNNIQYIVKNIDAGVDKDLQKNNPVKQPDWMTKEEEEKYNQLKKENEKRQKQAAQEYKRLKKEAENAEFESQWGKGFLGTLRYGLYTHNPKNYTYNAFGRGTLKNPMTSDNISSNLNTSNNQIAYNVNITQNITGTEANQIASQSANDIQNNFLALQAQNQFNK